MHCATAGGAELSVRAPRWGAWGEVGMAANLDDASQRRMAMSPMPPFTNVKGSNDLHLQYI